MTVGELLGRISSRELSEWMSYYSLEPWGEFRDDYRMGIIASTIANVAPRGKGKTKIFKPEDFIPEFGLKQKAEDLDEETKQKQLYNKWLNVVAAFGGQISQEVTDSGQPASSLPPIPEPMIKT